MYLYGGQNEDNCIYMGDKMKILEFLKDKEGQFSSARLFALMVAFSAIIDWQHAVWTGGIWTPTWQTVGLIAGVLGFKVLQKGSENKH